MGVVAINFVEFGSLLFEVTKNFRNFQKIMKRFLRGSSSRSSKEKQNGKAERPKYNLPRTTEASLLRVLLNILRYLLDITRMMIS